MNPEPLFLAVGIAIVAHALGYRSGRRDAFEIVTKGIRRCVTILLVEGRKEHAQVAQAILTAHERFVAQVTGDAKATRS